MGAGNFQHQQLAGFHEGQHELQKQYEQQPDELAQVLQGAVLALHATQQHAQIEVRVARLTSTTIAL